ncbi:MAG TPA: S53 family peptidase [Polyangiaceae bacterium]|nr:S53 family peptidase [Polyangiaceae bacterium]
MIVAKRTWALVALPWMAFLPLACASNTGGRDEGNGATAQSDEALDADALSVIPDLPFRPASCAAPAEAGFVRCHSKVRVSPEGNIQVNAAPSGLAPKDLLSAYKVPSGGKGTIAIVDAQDDPNAEADLAQYRSTFGLPACTTANGCFKKLNENGKASPLPTADPGWASEIALDIEMASAICPGCKIILLEADQPTIEDLGKAVNTAVTLGATVVSNSYGGGEDNTDPASDKSFFTHAGVAVFASSGDSGFGVEYPAAGANVIGVGGTSLTKSSSARGWAEKAWNGAGSGCSQFTAKPSWQTDTGCKNKTVADLSAIADPSTGVAVFDSFGVGGWAVFGGTSVASPVVASIFAATKNGAKSGKDVWTHTSDFFDVTSGNNGTCTPKYLCTARKGFDGPTGWGTPNASKFGSLAVASE